MRCHAALRGTRGVVLSIASINLRQAALSWLGIGNVSGLVCRGTASVLAARNELLVRPGWWATASCQRLHASVIPLRARDMLNWPLMDQPAFFRDLAAAASAQSLADDIIAHYCHRNDDALVVVARAS